MADPADKQAPGDAAQQQAAAQQHAAAQEQAAAQEADASATAAAAAQEAAADAAADSENTAPEAASEDARRVEAATETASVRPAREMTGVVTSAKPHKTIVVRVERRVKHPVYGKFIRRSTKLAAHDEANACNEGDTVTIRQTRPISKTKRWTLESIVERASA